LKHKNGSLKLYAFGLLVAAAAVAGCSSANGPLDASTSIRDSAPTIHHATTATTTFKIFTQGLVFGNFQGTFTPEPCWTVSPNPLPVVSTKKVSVSYTDAGCSNRSLTITYESGYGTDVQPCSYKIHYPVGGPFAYSTQSHGFIQCAVATAPPSDSYDEQLIYGPIGSNAHKR
jgi:hypothetical protein